jgi:diguanylate cyclase (GGDEF)-like protein
MAETTAALVDPTRPRRHWVGRALGVPMSTGTFGGAVSITVQLAACLTAGWVLGGSEGTVAHWYYLPIVFAGLRFGVIGALLTAMAAALLAGPLTPLDIDNGIAQPTGGQALQAVAFVVVGVGLALIFDRTLERTRRELSGRELGEQVEAAIDRGDVTVEYQPIWATRAEGEQMIGAEALVRWVDADLGAVAPGTFVPLLEEAGRLDGLGLWVLDQACRHLAHWQASASKLETPFHLAVNVSGVQLDDGFPELVEATLARHGADATGLVLELTERTLLDDLGRATPLLARIKDLGVRIAIDDFGTGYSSLAYLRDLDFDIVKLDRAFIGSLGSTGSHPGDADAAIVGAVIALARQMGKEVVVEGVESRNQLEALEAMGPVNVQGSLLSSPVSGDVLAERLGVRSPPSAPASSEPLRRKRSSTAGRGTDPWWRREIAPPSSATTGSGRHAEQVILAGMFLAGALLVIAVVLFSDSQAEGTRMLLGVAALPCALLLHGFRHRVPDWVLHGLVLSGTALILATIAVDPVPTTTVAASALLIWVTIYASAFFGLRAAVAHGLVAAVGFAVVLRLHPVEQTTTVWLLVMGTAGVAGFVVGWFARRLNSLAATDALTGLPNRQAFESVLGTEIDRAERGDTPLAVALVDLDDFKAINDGEGHQAGDRALAALPEQWRRELRAHDVLARYGGDEFVVLLPNCPLDDAEDALTRMSRAGWPTCSVGVVAVARGERPEMVLARADAALYRAKTEQAVVRSDRSVPTRRAVGGPSGPARPTVA